MLRVASTSLQRMGGGLKIPCLKTIDDLVYGYCGAKEEIGLCVRKFSVSGGASCPSLSIWRGRKKEMGKEGLIIVKELKRLKSNPVRLGRFMQTQVSRLLKTDLFAVLAEFQRQNQVFLSIKIYETVRKEIWYRPDMFFYRDMLMMLARNKDVKETKRVWEDLKREEVLFDQHTYGDIIRSFLDSGLQTVAMDIYEDMRQSPDPPLSLPYRVILKGLLPYPELRESVKDDFLELFPNMIMHDSSEDLCDVMMSWAAKVKTIKMLPLHSMGFCRDLEFCKEGTMARAAGRDETTAGAQKENPNATMIPIVPELQPLCKDLDPRPLC